MKVKILIIWYGYRIIKRENTVIYLLTFQMPTATQTGWKWREWSQELRICNLALLCGWWQEPNYSSYHQWLQESAVRASIVSPRVKPLSVMWTDHITALVRVPDSLFPTQLPATVLGKAVEAGSRAWSPPTLMEMDRMPSYWLKHEWALFGRDVWELTNEW